MICIAICDDDPQAREQVRDAIVRTASRVGVAVSVQCYPSAQAFLFDPPARLDMLVTDIEMPRTSGLELVGEARRLFGDFTVVLATNYVKYALDGYKVGAYRYLLKPVVFEQLYAEIAPELIRLDQTRSRTVALCTDEGDIVPVQLARISYFSSDRHRVEAHTDRGAFTCTKTLSAIEEDLGGEPFFRCHKSYLVNLGAIESVLKEEVLMRGGDRLPVSRRRYKDLVAAFTGYLGELM